MGGNAHKHIKVDRLSTEVWIGVADRLKAALMATHKFKEVVAQRRDPDKVTHGDLDLMALLHTTLPQQDLNELCTKIGLTDKAEDHSYIYRFRDGVYQVDLNIVETKQAFDLTHFCLSYGDVGMIIPFYLKRLDLRLTRENGLCYAVKLPLHGTMKYYSITTDVVQICDILGLEYTKWHSGFKSRQDVFDWLAPLEYGSITPCAFKKKYEKREMLQQYIALKCAQPNQKSKSQVRERIYNVLHDLDRFQLVLKEHEMEIAKEAFDVKFKKAFNGSIVTTHLREAHAMELKGLELGAFMSNLRKRLLPNEIPSHVTIKDLIDCQVMNDKEMTKR